MDPANVTLEAEHFPEVDKERYARRKPLLWFWQMFDRSPIGLNQWLGMRFRCMLGRHIFDHMGTGVKIHHGVEITFGYNTSIGDGAVIRKYVALNDRGGLRIGNGAVIGSYSRIFSHTSPREDLGQVRLLPHDDRRQCARGHPRDCAGGHEYSCRRSGGGVSVGQGVTRG